LMLCSGHPEKREIFPIPKSTNGKSKVEVSRRTVEYK
jgi:hypothetical protein